MGVSVKIMRSTVFYRNGEPPYKFKTARRRRPSNYGQHNESLLSYIIII